MRHCAKCGEEYETRVERCSECGEELSEGPTPVAVAVEEIDPLEAVGELRDVASSRSQAEVRILEGVLRGEGMRTTIRSTGSDTIGPYGGTHEAIHVLLVEADRFAEAHVALARADVAADEVEDMGDADDDAEEIEVPAAPAAVASTEPRRGSLVPPLVVAVGFVLVCVIALHNAGEKPALDDPSISQYEEHDRTFAMLGAIALAALMGVPAGVWVMRRQAVTRAVVIFLLTWWILPVLAIFIYQFLTT